MINKKDVQHIAKLARLNMDEKEEEKFAKELSSILNYVEKLKKINIKKIEPTSHPFEIENVTRRDIPGEPEEEMVKNLAKNAPAQERNYIKVKAILNSSEK